MKTLLEKLNNAKHEIKNTKIEKAGWNDYSQYAYFTPEQIEYLVAQACKNNGLLTTFELIRNELGIYGKLTIYEIETGESLKLQMATEIPQIKATNTAQQLGGCMTYTERYLNTSAFGITDNRLDFDTTENTKKQVNAKEPGDLRSQPKPSYPQRLNDADFKFRDAGVSFTNALAEAGYTDIEQAYAVTDTKEQDRIIKSLSATFRREKK